jgi:lipoyl(octanoyl) transferase
LQLIHVVQLGRVPYAQGLELQDRLVAERKAGTIGDTLLLLEHPPVITLGRNAKHHNVVASPEDLARRGVELFECNRGGDVTYHGPGQLVGYPIFNILQMEPRLGAVDFVRRLEEVLIRTCADFGISTHRVKGMTGVWTDPQSTRTTADDQGPTTESKIAALGIHISRGVTSHGFALNVNTDLSHFELIVPCGIADKPVTSVACELGRDIDFHSVAEAVARQFGSVFQSQVLWVESIDKLHHCVAETSAIKA